MTGLTAKSGTTSVVTTGITYKNPTSTTTSTQVYKWTTGGKTYTYTYDVRGNITAIADGTYTTTYAYDSLDQLTRENNQAAGKTWVYAYDNGGNILSKTEYAYTTGTLGTALDTITYGYSDSYWKDLLTSYDGQTLTSDNIGNLTNDGTWSYTWQHGRQLSGMTAAGKDASYTYDAEGHRIGKHYEDILYFIPEGGISYTTVRYPVDTEYFYLGDTLSHVTMEGYRSVNDTEIEVNVDMRFTYDAVGPLSVNYNGAEYFYLKNAQGDVTGIVNAAGTQVVAYTYDAWGKLLSTTGSMAGTLGEYNPLRYRGYVYDTETGLYYLNSRYYNPETGRFINADALSDQSSVLGQNLFAYCRNNPVNLSDTTGNLPFFAITAAIGAVVGAVVGGIVAAKSGGNVWAGIGIGAAVGALIGTGAGMAAGAALAGSITATTGAVMTGGSTLVATVGTGGLGAGATYIANNLSQAANNLFSTAQTVVNKMQDVADKGKTGEALSGLTKNTAHIPSLTGTASYRIPDGLNEGMKVLSEVKNYSGTLSYTNQLKDFVMWSQDNGYQMHLYTNARLTGPLQQVVDSGVIQLFPLG